MELLANQPRRRALVALERTEGKTTLEWLARSMAETDAVAFERRLVELHHLHLPALDESAVLEYNPESKVVRRGPAFETAASVLDAIDWDS